jgi:CBS-domain-containing membrane protein
MPRRFIHRHQTRQCLPCWLKAGLGAALALGLVAVFDQLAGAPLLAAPFGASVVLVFGLPDSPLSQPANVVGSHLIATTLALLMDQFLPGGWPTMVLGAGAVIALLGALRLTHPPAGADPLVVMMAHPGWSFLVMPVMVGAITLVAVAVLVHRLPPRSVYPLPVRKAATVPTGS